MFLVRTAADIRKRIGGGLPKAKQLIKKQEIVVRIKEQNVEIICRVNLYIEP